MRDSTVRNQVKRVISPDYLATGNTAFVGQIIDHQGYDSAEYVIAIGALADADATFAVLLEESDASDLSGSNAVADADMVSQTRGTAAETAAGFQFDDDNEVRKLGYVGNKRYTRLTITPANNTGNVYLSAVCILSHASHEPITQASA